MVFMCDVPAWASSARNERDEDMLASMYRGIASGKPDCDTDNHSNCGGDLISVPVYFAQPVREERHPQNVIGKRVATIIMMAIAMAIATTLVWHITESDTRIEWRRTQHSAAGPDVGVIAHAAHAAEPRLTHSDDDKPRARRRTADVHDTVEQDPIEPPNVASEEAPEDAPEEALLETSKIRRRAHRQQLVEPGFVEVAEGRAAHHLDQSLPILRVYRAAERDEEQHPKLYEHPKEPPSAEELLRPWKLHEVEDSDQE